MVRQKVRTRFLLFKKSHGKAKGKNSDFYFKKKKKDHMVRQKVRTQFLLFKKKSKGMEKGKNSTLTFQKKNNMVRQKVRTQL